MDILSIVLISVMIMILFQISKKCNHQTESAEEMLNDIEKNMKEQNLKKDKE